MDFYSVNNERDQEGEPVTELLNGLYHSTNVNFHKFRDYDPKLPNYVKLKE